MDGWPALSIHGDKSQQERDWVLAEFKGNKSPIMLATDVAARGLGRTKLNRMILQLNINCSAASCIHCYFALVFIAMKCINTEASIICLRCDLRPVTCSFVSDSVFAVIVPVF